MRKAVYLALGIFYLRKIWGKLSGDALRGWGGCRMRGPSEPGYDPDLDTREDRVLYFWGPGWIHYVAGTRRSDLCYRQWDRIKETVEARYGDRLRAIAGGGVLVGAHHIDEGESIPGDRVRVKFPVKVIEVGAEVERYVRGLRA